MRKSVVSISFVVLAALISGVLAVDKGELVRGEDLIVVPAISEGLFVKGRVGP